MNASKLRASPQLDLFAAARPVGEAAVRRIALDETSWIVHAPGWYADPDGLFADLSERATWDQRSRWMFTQMVTEPRLTAEFPVLAQAPVAEVRAIGERLSKTYGVAYDSVWLNLYRDQNDSTAWHCDRGPSRRPTSIVPVLSMGATRRFLVRRKDGGPSTTFVVEAGDLIVMGGRCQRDWVHGVPKENEPLGPRISINFGSRAPSSHEP